jgi:enoyl-CoA hydratase
VSELVLVERDEPIAVVKLNRPDQLNALSEPLMEELVERLTELDRDEAIRCIVLAGNDRAFAAGADIGEMATASAMDMLYARRVERWDAIRKLWTPLVAAVSGFCLGGGNELAMSCDLIVASETAKFGQPEITLGVIPGMGGSQRLTRAVGKAKAMDLVLTGRMMDAAEAERAGLVSRVVAPEKLMEEVLTAAEKIASFSLPAVMMAKEAVSRSLELTLAEGLRFERRLFHSLFATEDQKEGMAAFVAKRKPEFKHR